MKQFVRFWNQISIEHLWPLTVVSGIIAFLNTHPVMPHDFWWHLAIGRDILREGAIPLVDIYSYTQPGVVYPSYHQFWLMDIFLFLIYDVGGIILTILAQTVMVASAYLLLLWLAYRRTKSWRSAALGLIFAAALGFGNWNVRPQAITYLFAVLFLFAIDMLRQGGARRWLLIFPLIMMLWVNSHGSFPIGFALVGIWWLEEAWSTFRKWKSSILNFEHLILATLAGIFSILGVILNPRGVGFIAYLSTLTGNKIVQTFITEWMPPTFDTLEGGIFLGTLLGLAVLMAVSPRRPGLGQILHFFVFGFLALQYIRGVVWFGIVMAPFVAEDFSAILSRAGIQSSQPPSPLANRLNKGIVTGLAVLLLITLPWFKPFLPFTPEKAGLIGYETPIEATQYIIKQQLPGRIFHGMAFGSYLIWAAQPNYPVFVDSRIEMFPPEIWNDYMAISNGAPGWNEKLAGYGVNILMLEPKNQAGLVSAAEASGEWERVYTHPAVIILIRR